MRTTCILSALTGRSVCLTLTSSSPTNKQCVAVEEAEDAVVDAARAVVDTEIVPNAAETVPIAVIVPSVEIALNAETVERVVERVAARAVVAVGAAVEMLLPDVAVEGENVAVE